MDVELLHWRDLVARAGSPRTARTWLEHERWWRVCHDVYAPFGVEESLQLRLQALTLVVPTGTAVSHRTALWLLGVDVHGDVLQLTSPRGHRLAARPGTRPSSALLEDRDLCLVGGLLAVSAARAVTDVLRAEPLVEAVVVADAALRAGVATQEQVSDVLERSAGLRGVERARRALPHLEPRSESPQETRLRMRLVLGGLPRPQAQADLYDDEGHVARLDLELEGVGIEYDGRASRLERPRFADDRRRQNRIADLGVELRRFTAHDVFVRPAAALRADVLRAIGLAATRDRSRVRRGPDTLPSPRRRPLPTLADLTRRAA
jgi:hypothetical protein